jgi:hypothetical protein
MFGAWAECDSEMQGRVMAARKCGDTASGIELLLDVQRGVEMSGERLESTPVSVPIRDCFTVDRAAPAYLLSRPAVWRRVRATLALAA